jgi:hypothetical protein
MIRSVVDNDAFGASSVSLDRALAALDCSNEGADRHGHFGDVAAAPQSNVDDAVADFEPRWLAVECDDLRNAAHRNSPRSNTERFGKGPLTHVNFNGLTVNGAMSRVAVRRTVVGCPTLGRGMAQPVLAQKAA